MKNMGHWGPHPLSGSGGFEIKPSPSPDRGVYRHTRWVTGYAFYSPGMPINAHRQWRRLRIKNHRGGQMWWWGGANYQYMFSAGLDWIGLSSVLHPRQHSIGYMFSADKRKW